ncbi:hypothetical protein Ancab_025541 [Ancistrocladus abbreviatus]
MCCNLEGCQGSWGAVAQAAPRFVTFRWTSSFKSINWCWEIIGAEPEACDWINFTYLPCVQRLQLGTMPVLTSEAVNAPGGLEDFTSTNGDANVSLYKIKPSIRLPDQLQCCRMPSYSCSNLAAAAAFYCCYDRQPPE